ncbi:MAG: conserved rane protein of unknown function [Caulobacter sp.]|nr:conserved rane protein of unknown function [Caulobacter sp.]
MRVAIFGGGDGPAMSLVSRVCAGLLVVVYLLGAWFVASHTHHRLDPSGSPLFYDFSAFYQAGAFADAGHPLAAYDDNAMVAAEHAAFPGMTPRLPWNYPPSFQLALMPLAALPYVTAWLVWTGLICGAYALMTLKLARSDHRWLLLLAPAVAINVLMGQNGLLSTALLGAGVLMLERRPILGGLVLGLLTYKPHFAVLVPVVLLFGREWRAFAASAASALATIAASALVLGVAPWLAFIQRAMHPMSVFSTSSSTASSVPSVMIMAQSLGLNAQVGAICHWLVAGLAAIACVWIWRRSKDGLVRAAALAAATLLVTPYLRLYDLALLALPIAAMLEPRVGKPSLGAQTLAAIAWVLPALLLFSAPPVQLAPLAPIALLAVLFVRTKASGDQPRASATEPLYAPPSSPSLSR